MQSCITYCVSETLSHSQKIMGEYIYWECIILITVHIEATPTVHLIATTINFDNDNNVIQITSCHTVSNMIALHSTSAYKQFTFQRIHLVTSKQVYYIKSPIFYCFTCFTY